MKSGNKDSKQIDFSKITEMTYKQFDDYMRSGRGGKGEESALTLIHYLSHAKNLTNYEKCLLQWHIGQNYAACGKNNLAIQYFNLAAKDKNSMVEIFGPAADAYFKASVAFLNHETEIVKQQLHRVLKIPMVDYPPGNVVMLPGRIRDMAENSNKSYSSIFEMTKWLPPFPGQENWHAVKTNHPHKEGQYVAKYLKRYRDIFNSTSPRTRPSFTQLQAAYTVPEEEVNIVLPTLAVINDKKDRVEPQTNKAKAEHIKSELPNKKKI